MSQTVDFLPWYGLNAKHRTAMPINKVPTNPKELAVPPTHVKNNQKTLGEVPELQTTGYWHKKHHCVF